MSQPDKGVYAASCNPPRRAKRQRSNTNQLDTASSSQIPQMEFTPASPTGTMQPRPILPKRIPSSAKSAAPSGAGSIPNTPLLEPESSEPVPVRPPNKRGRKPGPLSRSAREAQRRLNHSIIEKARRTKINNALATLKELVPLDYGKKSKSQDNSDDEDEGDEDDEDGDYGGEKKKPKNKPSGKKEEKEREYKLEILVRTVSYMQDLLHRVAVLEQANPLCSKCGALNNTTPLSTSWIPSPAPPSKRARTERYDRDLLESTQGTSPSILPQEHTPDGLPPRNRLPSISSWLPETLLDQSIFNASSSRADLSRVGKDAIPPLQLPTPPSSTQFQPAVAVVSRVSTSSPSVNATRQKVSSSPLLTRTPEDEHAASMLLQISGGGVGSSPTFRPLPPSIMSPTEPPLHMLSSGSTGNVQPRNVRRRDNTGIAVQTPSSLLGLMTPPSI
ncbi:hypothetical protein NP233_g4057 [Leucocoprinus birnbaumii]|uniref:BHLH domain-containing protein n=1 Tax=Leucocoprinus birnbaumii TaxID=56174 RepID=A0AAD5VVD2_9AGAR|nr:hypothetical protein NP233_g4057 [Leucocoprinus birnbaumii]